MQQTVYDRASLKNLKSAAESQKAAELTAEDARNLVVQAVSNAYLAVISDSARVDAIQAELNTAQALLRSRDGPEEGRHRGGNRRAARRSGAARPSSRGLLAQKNQVEKDKLVLARAIGLPAGQQFG